MLFSSALVSLLTAVSVTAAPALTRRAAADILVFTFADVLEQLEAEFYTQALSKFQEADFTTAGFSQANVAVEQFTVIQGDEATHSTALQAALRSFGAEPITSCKFNFESALVDVATMAATARVVEAVGVSAYLGAAPLLTDPVLLVAAASILTIEARHSSILNVLGGTGSAIPAAFDFAFTPSEVLALALPFIDTSSPCDLGVPANTVLTPTVTGPIVAGTKLTFTADTLNSTVDQSGFFCQMLVGGATSSIALPLAECIVPEGINGNVAIWVTSDGQPLLNNVRDRATTQLVAGPTMAFVDTQQETLSLLARGGVAASSSGESTTVTTTTISPAAASSIIANAPSSGGSAGESSTTSSSASTGGSAGESASTATSSAASASTASPEGQSSDGAITVMGMSVVPAS